MASLATELTAFVGMDDMSSFPFVTMSAYEANAEHARVQAGVEVITFHPLVSDLERTRWEKYSVDHQGWIQLSKELYAAGEEDYDESDYVDGLITPYIHEKSSDGIDVRTDSHEVSFDATR